MFLFDADGNRVDVILQVRVVGGGFYYSIYSLILATNPPAVCQGRHAPAVAAHQIMNVYNNII